MSTIELKQTENILLNLGKLKTKQLIIGFALETENELVNARQKLRNKNADLIVLNSLNDRGAGFGTETNKVTFVFPDRELVTELKSKKEIADDLADCIESLL